MLDMSVMTIINIIPYKHHYFSWVCKKVVKKGVIIHTEGQLLKQGLDWEWTGAGLEHFS